MNIDKKLYNLPLTKTNPTMLKSLFGYTNIEPFWIADMEFEIAKPIQNALIERIQSSSFGYEYRPESFYNAQKVWYLNEYGINLKKDEIIFSPSITTTLTILIEIFTNKGDGIIIQPPVFMGFKDVIRKTERSIIKNPLILIDSKYKIDFDDLEEKVKSTNNKALIICNPHNPVGRVWSKKELKRIVDLCKENNTILISDEIHKDIILYDNKFTSALHFIDTYDKIVVCTSEAKTFNLCGISDSMAIIPNENIRENVLKMLKKYNLGTTNALTRVALETAYKYGKSWLKEVIKIIETNVNSIINELESSQINLIKPEATYQVWLDFRNVFKDSEIMFKHITENSKVAMNAGHWFGREGALFMRMNIATSQKKVVNAIKKIKQSVKNI
ncbi:aminotransferase, I and II [Deferribacter desulfuricans SSM1]|uniref:cysteine-S-conjugate beta-lyase n=1 Tax=Deferribacter desulfuricans (strain DSM 14783 / JCM 11476 / NBRC 101012 / SSM1) TaxID=639282 RepID=D3PCR1_DEFDS|nr:PatB family C-S lyase [Deferribacter desulfuricans]BAI80384.1 aminotransferase, I and II [Deferribacter desulfuricans SSM1]